MTNLPGAKLAGRFLVRRRHQVDPALSNADDNEVDDGTAHPVLITNVSLSFWGGIDPLTGVIVDTTHPLCGTSVRDTIFCLPSGRGSCTASQVLLELVLNDLAPRAIVLRDLDGLVAVGALIADEIFNKAPLDILHVGEDNFQHLLQLKQNDDNSNSNNDLLGSVTEDGNLFVASNKQELHSLKQSADTTISTTTNSVESVSVTLLENELTNEERSWLENATSEAQRMAYRVTFRYARLTQTWSQNDTVPAPAYTPVSLAHIDACTYIGLGGLEFTQRLVKAGGRVLLPTTLNAMSCDRTQWQALGVPSTYATNALALADAYLQLGCKSSFTCAPYLLTLQQIPKRGQDIVWGESNAVVYANSVLGARTNKVADYLDICGALTGIVPYSGVHVPSNRVPSILIDASEFVQSFDTDEIDFDVIFPVLGHLCGTLSDGHVPIVVGLEPWAHVATQQDYHLKAFCAAFGTTGSSPLIHVAGITAEATDVDTVNVWQKSIVLPAVKITMEDLQSTYETLNNESKIGINNDDAQVDLVALGNPHLSVSECERLTKIIDKIKHDDDDDDDETTSYNKHELNSVKKHDNVRVMACISRETFKQAMPYIPALQKFGFEFIHDTCWCMLLDPPVIPAAPNARILTNSGKYAHYGPALTQKSNFRFGSTVDCIRAAVSGRMPQQKGTGPANIPGLPVWLQKSVFHTNPNHKSHLFIDVCRVARYVK